MSYIEKLKDRLKTPEGAFIALGSFFGLFFLFLVPPLQTPDENVHFLRAYQVSQGQFISTNDGKKSGSYLPKSIQRTFDEVDGEQSISFHPELKFNIHKIKAAMAIELNSSDQQYYNVTAAAAYSPVGYIPQATAILTGTLLNLPPIFHIYLARLAVLVVWLAVFSFAIKLMPFKKWALVAIALLPMMVSQSISIGVDPISISTGVLFVSLILRSLSEKISNKTLTIMLLTATVMVLSKQIAIILLPLILLVNNNKFTSKKFAIYSKLLVIFAPIILLGLWTILAGNTGQSLNQIANHQSTVGQIKHLIGDPFHFIVIIFNTFFFSWGDSVVNSVIGIFGWMDTPLSGPFVALGYMTIATAFVLNYREKTTYLSQRAKRIIVATAFLYFIALCAALYITYSPVGFNIIYGLQGRYLLPILFLLVPVFASSTAIVTKRRYIFSTIAPILGLLIVSIITIWIRFYIDYKY